MYLFDIHLFEINMINNNVGSGGRKKKSSTEKKMDFKLLYLK